MNYSVYEDDYCYYIRKPAGRHTTFGKWYSFIEQLRDETSDLKIIKIFANLKKHFDEKDEYWLLNRLDTPTTWLLYFAKNPEIKKKYKQLQKEGKVKKYYLIEAWWDLSYWTNIHGKLIDYPIAHHKYENDRMVVLTQEEEKQKIKGWLHHVKTEIKEFFYDEMRKISVGIVMIEKWIRHQIRSHFSSIWYALVGDEVYGKRKDPFKWNLSLWSIWLSVEV